MIARTIYIFFPVFQTLLGLLIAWKYWDKVGRKTCLAYYLFRMAFLFTAWPLIDKVPMDIRVWAVHAQWLVDDKLFPVIDFPTAYHLGFNFLLWLAYTIWHSPYSIMVIFNLFELAAIPFMYLGFSELYGRKTAKRVVILFVTSVLCWYCMLAGQDEPVIIFFTSLLLYALSKSRFWLAAAAGFLCFSATKILVPIYYWANMLYGRRKGLLLLVSGMLVYWMIAFALGVNPFDFRSSVSLDSPGADLASAGYVRGSVWYYLREIPKVVHFIFLFGAWGLSALAFLKTLMDDNVGQEERLRLSCTLTAIVSLEFFAFYRVCYYPYMLPFVPFLVAASLHLDVPAAIRKWLVAALVVWLCCLANKEGGNRWIWTLGYVVDAIMYLGYAVFLFVFFYGSRHRLVSPLKGFKYIPDLCV